MNANTFSNGTFSYIPDEQIVPDKYENRKKGSFRNMPNIPLFGQIGQRSGYTTYKTSSSVTQFKYECSNVSLEGQNSLAFDDGELKLLDSQGNTITSLDLSEANGYPITAWNTGSLTINAHEAKLIDGIEFGKLLKESWFQIPDMYFEHGLAEDDQWNDYVNVSFILRCNIGLDLREYIVKTSIKKGESNLPLVDRVNQLLEKIGIGDSLKASIEESIDADGSIHHYLVFRSYVEGYDFIVADLRFSNIEIVLTSLMTSISSSASQPVGSTENENNVVFGDGKTLASTVPHNDTEGNEPPTALGHYDRDWRTLYLQETANHFYQVEMGGDPVDLGQYDNTGVIDNDSSEDSVSDSSEDSVPDSSTSVPEDSSTDDSSVITKIPATYVIVEENKFLSVPAFKYWNGAARCWFFTASMPDDSSNASSLLLNHVSDTITSYDPFAVWLSETDEYEDWGREVNEKTVDPSRDVILFAKREVDVYAGERNEAERMKMRAWLRFNSEKPEFVFRDDDLGIVEEVIIENTPVRPCIDLHIHNPHIGMYRYLDYVTENGMWTPFGSFYGVITNPDTDDKDVKNLANSVFIYNPNGFAVKVNYFIAS